MVSSIASSYCTRTVVAAVLALTRLVLEEVAIEAVPSPSQVLHDYLWLCMLLQEMAWADW